MVFDTNVVSAGSVEWNGAGVFVGSFTALVRFLDGVQNVTTARACTACQRDRPVWRVFGVLVFRQGTGVGLVEVQTLGLDLPVGVAGLFGNPAEQVSTAVPAAEGGQTPVGGHGGNDGVVGVESIILGATEVLGDSAAKKEGVDLVSNLVSVVLIEGEHNQRVLGEVFILEQVRQETISPGPSKGDVGIMRIVGHVRGNEHMLGQLLVVQVIEEGGEVLDLAKTSVILSDRVEHDQRVVLADVVTGISLGIFEPLVAGIRQMLLVLAPGNAFGIEQIGNGRDIGGDFDKLVVVHSKAIATRGGTIIGLRRVGQGPKVV